MRLPLRHAGRPYDECLCTHDHHDGGDECLSFQLAPELVDLLGAAPALWRSGNIAPHPRLMVLGELAQSIAGGDSEVGLDERCGSTAFVDLRLSERPVARSPR